MAKESMKAREVKRQKLVEKYAEKRAKLKAEGDYVGLKSLPRNSNPNQVAQPLQVNRSSKRIYATIWCKPY